MPYTREEASHTAFVRRIVNKSKAEYLGKIEKALQEIYKKKRKTEGLSTPVVINEPPSDVNDKYILFQDLDTKNYLRSIDFDGGVCNMIVSSPHTRSLADPTRVRDVINTNFEQVDQIITIEDMEEVIESKDDNTAPLENENKNYG